MAATVVSGVTQGSRLTPAAGGDEYVADGVITDIGGLAVTRNVLIAGLIGLLVGAIAKA